MDIDIDIDMYIDTVDASLHSDVVFRGSPFELPEAVLTPRLLQDVRKLPSPDLRLLRASSEVFHEDIYTCIYIYIFRYIYIYIHTYIYMYVY